MYHNRVVPEMQHRIKTNAEMAKQRSISGNPTGQRTIEGAVIMTIAPIAVIVAASYPTTVAVIVAMAVGIFATAKYIARGTPPDTPTQQTAAEKPRRNSSASTTD